MMKIAIDEKYPLYALDECQAQLQVLSTLIGCYDTDVCLEEDDFNGLSSMIGLLAKTVKEVSRVLHEEEDRHRDQPEAAVAPHLTEPKPRTGRRAAV